MLRSKCAGMQRIGGGPAKTLNSHSLVPYWATGLNAYVCEFEIADSEIPSYAGSVMPTHDHFLRASASSMGGHWAPRHRSQYLRESMGGWAVFPHAVCAAAPASSRTIKAKSTSPFKRSSVLFKA
jgi:hypothetical protein